MNVSPPYFGAAYYPEAWPAGTVPQDLEVMKRAGVNVIRMAEFAWAQMEPVPGQFDFGWLRETVGFFAEAGIASILCTPSATPPIWLTKAHPEILLVDDNGRPRQHGERCHWCPNQPVYRERVSMIVRAMAEEFGKNRDILAWQIDNEPYPNRRGCCCSVCVAKFREHLHNKFGTIGELNATWGTNLWSQRYESFEDFEAPRSDIWHHPSLVTEWMRFQSDSYVEFVTLQAAILREYTDVLIGTDTMPMHRLNYCDVARSVDVMQFNHYPHEGDLRFSQFWMSYIRNFKKQPFWVTESSVSNSSATAVVKQKGYRKQGYVGALSWLPIVLGGEANLYWLWRCHWSGQELTHGSVVDSVGRPVCAFDEVAAVGKGYSAAAEFLAGTRASHARIALHFSCDAALTYEAQPLVDKFQYEDFYMQRGKGKGELPETFFQPLVEAHYAVDVIDPFLPLEDYSVVISPFLISLETSGVQERLEKWIKAGGVWVAGPMTDIRTIHGTKFIESPFGVLEKWTRAFCRWQVIGNVEEAIFDVNWKDGKKSGGRIWYDVFDAPEDAEILGTYANDRLESRTAAFSIAYGKGKIILLGTVPTPEAFFSLLEPFLVEQGIVPVIKGSRNVLAVPREGHAGEGWIIAEIHGESGEAILSQEMSDLLSGADCKPGTLKLSPYEVRLLKKKT
jgi:beta-galactosidase